MEKETKLKTEKEAGFTPIEDLFHVEAPKETSLTEKINYSHNSIDPSWIYTYDVREAVLRLKEDMCRVVHSKGFCNICKNCIKINNRFGPKLTKEDSHNVN